MSSHNSENGITSPALFSNLRHDLLASIVVFLVALPLCMGIAIASGVPVAAGLITGIVGGIVVGALAGSPLQVSGPAAGLTVIVAGIVIQLGLPLLGLVVLLAGALQLLAGLFRLGQWFRAVSPAVIHGMLAGIGVLIVVSQIHVMVDAKPRETGPKNLAAIPDSILKGLPLPEARSRESRRLRRDTLQTLGDLQASQRQLADDVDAMLGGPGVSRPSRETLASLAGRQEQLVARLESLTATLTDEGVLAENGRQAKRIQDSVAAALAAMQRAIEALGEAPPEQAHEAQQAALAALATISEGLSSHGWAAKLGLLTIALIVMWQSLVPKRLRLVPAPLVAIIVVTLLSAALYLPVQYIGVPGNLFDDLHVVSWSMIQQANWVAVIQAALVIAAVASAETLLCATAVDQMHRGPRTKYDRELCAQGFGNMICGFLGALPMTGVIVRSGANVQAGARTRMSAILHGAWLLIFVVFLAHIVRLIPTASLAAILVYTGYKLVNPKHITTLWSYGKGEVLVYGATVVTIVAVDLLTGVIVGIALAAFKLLLTFSQLEVHLSVEPDQSKAVLGLRGAATFLRLPKLAAALEQVPHRAELHVDLNELEYIDHACLDLVTSWSRQYESVGGTLVLDWDSLHARFRTADGQEEPSSGDRPSKAA